MNKAAKRSLVKPFPSDGKANILSHKMTLKSSCDEEFKSKKFKTSTMSSRPTKKFRQGTECLVLPSVVKLKKQRIIRLPSQDDLWKSIKSNYLFIMDNNLINECQKTRKEFSLYSPPSSPPPVNIQQPISFPEFIERFNVLHDKLHALQTSLEARATIQNINMFQTEMDILGIEYQFLKEQGLILQRLDPVLKDDVGRRCTILINKWKLLEGTLWPKKREQDEITKNLTAEVRSIRKWLREVEEKLRLLKVTDSSSPEEVLNVYNQEKVLQREIEERGKEINSLVRRCESATDGATTASHPTRLRRYALHLERSWHHIWIRSLEIQCLTEQHLPRHAAVITQNTKDHSDLDSDEGPLRKHRRLTLDHWTAVAATMDRLKKEQTKRDVIKGGLRTRDVGVLCSERVPVNDKCVMVGTTGIAALKAEYGDDFTNFEIIQDVGYSSESSTHLSGDDTGNDHFNVRIYKYSKDNQPTPLNLREEFEAAGVRNFHSLGSSLESSSSAAVSLDDSGLGTGENMATGDSSELLGQFRVDDDYEQEDLDYLETVLDECVDFGANVVSEPEELHFNISGIESDDPSDNFHNRSSFTTSAQVFYKMISVDSDNGETESSPTNENNNISSMTITENCATDEITINNNSIIDTNLEENNNNNNNMKCATSDSDVETFKHVQHPIAADNRGRVHKRPHRLYCSTPVRNLDDKYFGSHRHQGLKRKRDYDQTDSNRMNSSVRSWLKRCSDFSSPALQRKSLLQTSSDVRQSVLTEDVSSCDASCECTSSSADEGNVYSSTSSFFDDDVFRQKTRIDSCSAEGSVETVVHALIDSEFNLLLPPPPSSTVSYGSDSKNCSTISCLSRKGRNQMKASSEGDVRKRRSLKELSNLNSRRVVNRRNHSKTTSCTGPRLCSSLPNVLRHSSDSSTDENCIPSTLLSHSDTKTTLYANRSSSSDVGRRRRRRSRKKSSSSNRSSTNALYSGGDRSRLRSRTYTSSTSRCGSRGRHMSQRSEAFCVEVFSDDEACPLKVEIPPQEDNVAFEDLRRASSALLSPVESDIVLTHLEEQSTVSDQVWDGYQEMPYLSEGYSEATVDEDAVRKLTEFGDDYGSAIGNPIRLPDPADSNNNKTDSAQPHKKSPKIIPVAQRLQNINDDSDSDSEDLHYVIEAARKALHFAKGTLKRRQTGDPLSSADYAELLATCGTHLNCLQTVYEHIEIDGKGHNFSSCDLTQLNYLIEEWQELQRNIEMYEKLEDPARQKYLKAQENIDALFNKMSQLSSSSYLDIASWEDVEKNMARLQMVLTSLQEAKEQLLAVNLQAHRFTTEYGDDDSYKDCSLKDDITELYRQWEDTYEQNGLQLTELGMLKSDWETYDAKFRSLRHKVKEAEFQSGDDCDNICLMSTENDSGSIMKEFEELRHVAGSLEKHLKGGDAWKKIDEDMKDLRLKVYRKDTSPPQIAASQSANHRSPSTIVEEDADDHFEDAIQQLCDDSDHSDLSTPQKKDGPAAVTTPKRSRGRFWRIVRVAVPVQFALVLLYCLACYLEPTCCNMLNNFNFSFTPQLRYLGGRPPV